MECLTLLSPPDKTNIVMSVKPNYQRKCEVLKQLMLNLPHKYGLTLKEAGRRSKINLYKYRSNGCYPLTISLFSFGEAFNIGPDWLIRMACLVESGQLTEEQALEMLSRWQEFKPTFESAIQVALTEVAKKVNGLAL